MNGSGVRVTLRRTGGCRFPLQGRLCQLLPTAARTTHDCTGTHSIESHHDKLTLSLSYLPRRWGYSTAMTGNAGVEGRCARRCNQLTPPAARSTELTTPMHGLYDGALPSPTLSKMTDLRTKVLPISGGPNESAHYSVGSHAELLCASSCSSYPERNPFSHRSTTSDERRTARTLACERHSILASGMSSRSQVTPHDGISRANCLLS